MASGAVRRLVHRRARPRPGSRPSPRARSPPGATTWPPRATAAVTAPQPRWRRPRSTTTLPTCPPSSPGSSRTPPPGCCVTATRLRRSACSAFRLRRSAPFPGRSCGPSRTWQRGHHELHLRLCSSWIFDQNFPLATRTPASRMGMRASVIGTYLPSIHAQPLAKRFVSVMFASAV